MGAAVAKAVVAMTSAIRAAKVRVARFTFGGQGRGCGAARGMCCSSDAAARARGQHATEVWALKAMQAALHAHPQVGWGGDQVARFTLAFSLMTSLSRRSVRFLSAFCIFSWRRTGLTGGGVALRRSRRDGESIEIGGDSVQWVAGTDDFPVATPQTPSQRARVR